MTKSRVQINRSSVSRQRPPNTRDTGEMYVNFADRQIGVMDTAKQPMDMVAVRFFSEDAQYEVNEFVVYQGELYRAILPSTPAPFNYDNWVSYGLSTTGIDWSQIVNEPATFPPTLPILQSDVIGLQDELLTKITDAPSDGTIYGRRNALWVSASAAAGTPEAPNDGKPYARKSLGWDDLTDDLAVKMDKSGGTMTGVLVMPPGAQATPSITFGTASNGLYGDASSVRITTGGALRFRVSSTFMDATFPFRQVNGAVSAPSFTWTNDTDAGFYLSAAGDMRLAMAGVDVVKWLDDKSTTFSGKVVTIPSATAAAGLNLPHGAAPTSPVNGDIWATSAGWFVQTNGATKTLATLEGGTYTGKITLPVVTTTGAFLNLGQAAGTTGPSAPVDGDIWVNSSFNWRVGGTTFQAANVGNTQTFSGNKTFSGILNAVSGKMTFNASAAGGTTMNVAHGVAPSAPVNGDVWSANSGFYGQVNGVTRPMSIHVGTTAPASPITNDLWLDIN